MFFQIPEATAQRKLLIIGILWLLPILNAYPQIVPGCAACSEETTVEVDLEGFLESVGFPRDEFTYTLAWDETARDGGRELIHGIHVVPTDGSEGFDVYYDDNLVWLDDAELAALGIAPKRWDAPAASKTSEFGKRTRVASKSRPVPMSDGAPQDTVVLNDIDVAAVLAEDVRRSQTLGKGEVRLGVFQVFDEPIQVSSTFSNRGSWSTLPDGSRLWTVGLFSPDAIGQRIHFQELAIPEGGQVLVYNTNDPEEIYGPFPRPWDEDADVWSPTCFSEDITLELFLPVGVAGADLSLVIDRTVHMYRDLTLTSEQKYIAGSCNLDVTCFDDWATTATGIGGLGRISSAGSLFCTGTLLADTDTETDVPYFLAANHCVTGSPTANSLEIYWLFQTQGCDEGNPPSLFNVPRTTGGADFLAGSGRGAGTDVTLLRLREDPPPEISFVGWSSAIQTLGSPTTCIHHPRGDFKRITFGTLTQDADDCNCCDASTIPTRFHQSTWNMGTTEPGSSGSPLLNSSHQIIGQLWGGCASCTLFDSPDYYGRFDVSFPLLEAFIGEGDPVPPVVGFSSAVYNAQDGEDVSKGMVTIEVTLSALPGDSAPVSVDYVTSDGTAEAGSDYVATQGTLEFDANDTVRSFDVEIIADMKAEGTETIMLALSNPVGVILSPSKSEAVIEIADGIPPSFECAAARSESGGSTDFGGSLILVAAISSLMLMSRKRLPTRGE